MSAGDPAAIDAARADPPPRRKSFRFAASPKMNADAAARQGRAVSIAIAALGNGGEAIAFLNTHHPHLGARPIDLAVASADGLAQVEQAIASARPQPSR